MSPAIKTARETVAIKGVFDNQKGRGGFSTLKIVTSLNQGGPLGLFLGGHSIWSLPFFPQRLQHLEVVKDTLTLRS